jgi:type II secretory pathway component PulM
MSAFTLLPVGTQKLLAAGVAVVLLVAGSSLSWLMHGRVDAAQSRLSVSIANRQAMAELVARFEARAASGAAQLDLSAVVTRSLEGQSFQPSQIQQQNGELALRFDNAPFNEVLAWMLELEASGVVLGNVGIAQAQPEGVSLTLVLRGG